VNAKLVRCLHCSRTNRVPAVADGSPRCGQCHRPLPWIVDAGDDDFVDIAERADILVLVDMWASWCQPCRMVSPVLEQLARELAGLIKLVKVDVNQAPKLAERFAVQAVPTLMLIRNGHVEARQPGAAPAEELREWVDHVLRRHDVEDAEV
jgi:thioredoxin 2